MKVLVVAARRKLAGVYTQRKLLWAALERVEGAPLPNALLVLRDVGRIKGSEGRRFARCTYHTLCRVLAEDDKAELYDFASEELMYRVFVTEVNRCRLGAEGTETTERTEA